MFFGTLVAGKPKQKQSDSGKTFDLSAYRREQGYVRGQNGQGGSNQWDTVFYTIRIFTSNKGQYELAQTLREGDTIEVVGDLEVSPYERVGQNGEKIIDKGLTITAKVFKRPEMSKDTKTKLGLVSENGNGQQYPQQAPYPQQPAAYGQPPPQPQYQQAPPSQYPAQPQPGGYQQQPYPQQPPPGYGQPAAPQGQPVQPPYQQGPPPGYGQPQTAPTAPQPPAASAPPPGGYPPQAPPYDYAAAGDDFSNLSFAAE